MAVSSRTSTLSNQEKKKNFRIEAFKQRVVLNPRYAETTWKNLEHAIHLIYNQNTGSLSFEELYRNANDMVLLQYGEKMYMGLVTITTSHLKEISKSIEAAREAAQGDFFLEELNRKWNDLNKALQMIRNILIYMDNTYVRRSQKTPVLYLGLNLWRDNVVYSSQIQSRLLNTLLELVHRERIGEVINRGLIRNILRMLMDLAPSVYEAFFEFRYLEVSAEFYRGESQKFIKCCDCGDYLKKAEKHLSEEMDRVSNLDARSQKRIANVVEKEMIASHMVRLIHMENSGLVNMLLDDKYEDLGRMYNLFHRVPDGLLKIHEAMISHVRDKFKQLVTNPERIKDPVSFVQGLLDKKDKYDSIINLAFNNDNKFQNALNSSFEYFINLSPHSPEFISLFVDDKFRKHFKGVSEEDVEIILDKVVMLVRFLHEKDVFHMYYKKHLAKRLLSGKTISEDAERSLIVKLKKICWYQLLDTMVTDMKTSQDMLQGFYGSHPELGDGPTLTVQVLTTGSWPVRPIVTCNLPLEVSALHEKYQSYYRGIHMRRRLSWQPNMGTAEIKATFGKGQKHELHVSTYQMCVLMLFNHADRLSYKEIEKATKIHALDLKGCLYSMALVKGKNVIKKEPMSRYIGQDDTFSVNVMFTSKFYKVKLVTMVAQKESDHEKLQTRQRVEEDRKPHIEAAIMRIMKSRKQFDHDNIIAEVTRQLNSQFVSNPTDIEKRIESLIERDYLERDNVDNKLYRYLA